MNAWIYTRFSTRPPMEGELERRAAQEDEDSIVLQVSECVAYCARKGFSVAGVLKDPQVSARLTPLFERPQGSRLKDLPAGTAVVCLDIDRMFREVSDGLLTTRYFSARGIDLHFANQGGNSIDASTADGELFLTIKLGFASYEPRKTAERTSRGMLDRQARGQRMTAVTHTPYGTMPDPDDAARIIDCPAEIEMIAAAKRLRQAGVSLRAIGSTLVATYGPLRGATVIHPQKIAGLLDS